MTCACQNIHVGSHSAAIELVPPPFLAREDGRGICVDACLALEVSRLWALGIQTTGCCCGHNAKPPFIGVIDRDVPAMKALGYLVQPNPCRPNDEDSFAPHSLPTPTTPPDGEGR